MAGEPDLSGAVDVLKNMLGSDEGQQQLQGLISMLGGGGDKRSEEIAEAEENAEMLRKMQKLMSVMKSAENEKEAAFLRALAPLLRPERQEKLNHAVKLLGMGRAIKVFKEMQ
ncbi:MAG: hypothetical protein Q4E94_03090 [Clostridia bacterium]|nr:hypothetical protein [Clostridia bacterium]